MDKLIALKIPGPGGTQVTFNAPSGIPSEASNLNIVAQWIIGIVVSGLVLLALFYLLYGAVMWITSQGDKQKIESARHTIMYAIVGLLLTLFSVVLVKFIGNALGVDFLNVSL